MDGIFNFNIGIMQLEQQFIRYTPVEFEEEYAIKCAEIAENFAIGFLDWCRIVQKREVDGKSSKEILEIYKKTL